MILDEPTAALGVAETAEVLALIHRLRERGLGVIVISHNLDTVFDVADRSSCCGSGAGRHLRAPTDDASERSSRAILGVEAS